MWYKHPKNEKLGLNSKLQTYKILTNDDFFVFFLVYYYCNTHNAAISLKSIHFIDKIKLILTLQVRNSITNLTITYMIQSRSISQRLFLYSYYQPPFACKGSNLFRAEGTIVSRAKYLLVAFFAISFS